MSISGMAESTDFDLDWYEQVRSTESTESVHYVHSPLMIFFFL